VVLLAFEMKKRQFVFLHAIITFSKGLLELVQSHPKDELEPLLRIISRDTAPHGASLDRSKYAQSS